MSNKAFQALLATVLMGFAIGASAQSFVTDVTINKPGTSSAKYLVQNGEGTASFKANDGYATLEVPDGTPRLVIRNGNLGLNESNPLQKIHLYQASAIGARFRVQNTEGTADFAANDGLMQLFVNNILVGTITQAGNMNLIGQMSTTVLEIRGGADLSENFDVNKDIAAIPGMVVSIDAENPGKLAVAREAYDTKVAGVISGAGGLNTGMVMSQQGNDLAHGDFPVALTGRVYVYVDADLAPVHPGDLLTTSVTPGHAMRAVDPTKAMGATIGKAMTALESGKGLVLVLVNLH